MASVQFTTGEKDIITTYPVKSLLLDGMLTMTMMTSTSEAPSKGMKFKLIYLAVF